MAQFYTPDQNAAYSQLSAGGGGGGAQEGTLPPGDYGNDAGKRRTRDQWIEQSDPSYWMKQWEERSKRPEEAGTIENLLRYHGTPEAWAKNQAETAKRQYKTDLERDASQARRKRNFLIAAGLIATAGLASAAAAGAAPAAGATAAPAATGATTGTALTGAGKGAIAAGAAGQSAGSGAALTAAGKGAALGAGQLATGGGLTMATVPTIATPAATGGLAAYTPVAIPGGSAGTMTITAGSGASTLGAIGKYGKWANSALQAANSYSSAKEQEAAAKAARKGTTTTRTPYYNEAISQLARYILQEAQRVYASRQAAYGSQAGNFSPFAAMLAQIPSSYRGV